MVLIIAKKCKIKEVKKMKKIYGVFVIVVLIATAFAALPLNVGAGSTSANTQVPFKGTFDGGNVPAVDPLERIVVSGDANQLGEYTAVVDANMAVYDIVGWVEVAPGIYFPILRLPTKATFTAANGDELYADMDLIGMRHMVDGNFPSFTLDATITGGTGRFEGATGSFNGVGGQITMPGNDTDLVVGSWSGTISTVGSN
jgi:hypothetical protein